MLEIDRRYLKIVIKNNKEEWYKSRRVWASGLSLIATIGVVIFPEKFELIVGACTLIASSLGIQSFRKPKK